MNTPTKNEIKDLDIDLDILNILKPLDDDPNNSYLYIRSTQTEKKGVGSFLSIKGDPHLMASAICASMEKDEQEKIMFFNAVLGFIERNKHELPEFKGFLEQMETKHLKLKTHKTE